MLLGESELYYLHQAEHTEKGNERASRVRINFSLSFLLIVIQLCGRSVYGDAVVMQGGKGGRHLYNLMRPELVRSNAVPLSRYAFFAWFSANPSSQ